MKPVNIAARFGSVLLLLASGLAQGSPELFSLKITTAQPETKTGTEIAVSLILTRACSH